ncbi:MAG: class I tRNA ligase family protein [Candidatus Komeilibacteria bacterium]|nr:class I tRNA ligase family protein [Candidatus Komeilibacteria bacterium]
MDKKFYITTPIYYVNDKPHAGHAYTTLVADVLARYHRQNGEDTFFLTGTDEHGSKIAEAAAKHNQTPQEFCDQVSGVFKTAWDKDHLGIAYDYFIRTTDPNHEQAVRDIFQKLLEAKTPANNPVLYEGEYAGLYCTGCEKFLTEKELVNGLCPDHKRAPEVLKEKNYFFRLADYLPAIEQKIVSGELQILPEHKKNEALGFIKQNVPDFSVSRSSVKWGVDLPFAPGQVAYVWIDALSNYITALGYPKNLELMAKYWPADVQLMAQDISKFHTIYWPALLMALNLPLPKTMFIHGFFTIDGQKMSKSIGNVIDPNDLVAQFGQDGTRYLLLSQFPLGQEADLQASLFKERYNNDLANGLGNLVARTANMIETYLAGKNPITKKNSLNLNNDLPDLNKFFIYEYLVAIRSLIDQANRLIDEKKPWQLVKTDLASTQEVLGQVGELIILVAEKLAPIMPAISAKITKQFTSDIIKKEEALFPRLN